MLSYRHAFHAGNHADVLKHFVLMQVLQHATQKDKPLWYIDTHAGAGMYALDKGYATQNAEFASGISRLWHDPHLPTVLADYVALLKKLNPDGQLKRYPGSPAFAQALLRHDDRLRLFELHPNDCKLLRQFFKEAGHSPSSRKVIIETADGFAGLKAILPPPSRRAVVLIDPPYEEKQDYRRVLDALKDSLQRFATGTYILWYPLLQRPEPRQLHEKLQKLGLSSWLQVTLSVQAPSPEGFGMHGSGLFIVNPPWTLPETLGEVMPYLVNVLGQDAGTGFSLEHKIP
jgi:23S rRNA (adenine2030-N6)-methyltransferase